MVEVGRVTLGKALPRLGSQLPASQVSWEFQWVMHVTQTARHGPAELRMGPGPGPGTGLAEDSGPREEPSRLRVRVPSCLLQPRVLVRSTDSLSLVACWCSSDRGAQSCSQDR